MADGIKAISKGISGLTGSEYLNTSFVDVIDPKPADDRTYEEIVNHVFGKLKGESNGST